MLTIIFGVVIALAVFFYGIPFFFKVIQNEGFWKAVGIIVAVLIGLVVLGGIPGLPEIIGRLIGIMLVGAVIVGVVSLARAAISRV